MVSLTESPIDPSAWLLRSSDPAAGAQVVMLGVTRGVTGDETTLLLEYEAHRPLAEAELARIEAEARDRWPLIDCSLVHRLGPVPVGEASVLVAAAAAHRDAAFEAARYLIDTLKQRAPIWKRDHRGDGSTAWVHPGLSADPEESP